MHVKKIILSILIYSFSQLTWGLETFEHPHCSMYLGKVDLRNKDISLLKSSLANKGYQIKKEDSTGKILNNSFYVNIKRTFTGGVYKECLIELEIKKAMNQKIASEDSTEYKKSSLRKFPRQTFHGDERCTMALKDLFFDINICKIRK